MPGGFQNAAECCPPGHVNNASIDRICCAKVCPPGPFAWDEGAVNSANPAEVNSIVDDIFPQPKLDMATYSCAAAVITPLYIAVCVCDPENADKTGCSWSTTAPATLRLRLFLQESLLAILLLMNYMEIVIEHMLRMETTMREQGRAVACCRAWSLRLLQAAIPFSIMVIALADKAFNEDHAVNHGFQAQVDDLLNGVALRS